MELGVVDEGPVRGAEVLDDRVVALRGDLGVAPGDLLVGEHQVGAGIAADGDRPVQVEALAGARSLDDFK